jgi:L-threonylcarbamoyladenylate synthase
MSNTLDQACEQLQQGHVIGMPTETVYGLAADATRDEAVAEIYTYKQRPRFHPLISHVSSIDMACGLGVCDAELLEKVWMHHKWSLTVIVKRHATSPLSWLTTAGLDTVAIRYPQHEVAQKLIQSFGKPLAAPSANMFGSLSPVRAEHVRKTWPDVVVVDGGPCRMGLESTIVDLTSGQPTLLRLGATSRDDLLKVWPTLTVVLKSSTAAPGTLPTHYRPRTPLRLNQHEAEPGGVLVGFGCVDGDVNLSPSGNVVEAAAQLFHVLHTLDESGYTGIAVAPIPDEGLGEAINDRLQRACSIPI